MAAIDDLKAEIAVVGQDVTAGVQKIADLVAQLQNVPPDQSQAITDATNALKAAVAPLEAVVNPPPAS